MSSGGSGGPTAGWPKGTTHDRAVDAASRDITEEATRKAARKLGVSPQWVALAARRTWRRSLAEERDARLRDRGWPDELRALQAARGHVTRVLLGELAPVVAGFEDDPGWTI